MLPRALEGLLRDVLGQHRIAEHGDRDTEHLALEPAHERDRDLGVASGEPGQQSLVRKPLDGDPDPAHIIVYG